MLLWLFYLCFCMLLTQLNFTLAKRLASKFPCLPFILTVDCSICPCHFLYLIPPLFSTLLLVFFPIFLFLCLTRICLLSMDNFLQACGEVLPHLNPCWKHFSAHRISKQKGSPEPGDTPRSLWIAKALSFIRMLSECLGSLRTVFASISNMHREMMTASYTEVPSSRNPRIAEAGRDLMRWFSPTLC